MYYRLIASITRDHLREHLPAALEAAQADAALVESNVTLPVPKVFDVASYVGGVAGLSMKGDFPVLSIDSYNKALAPDKDDFWSYRYDGHITGMVGGSNPRVVEMQAKGYGGALESIIKAHAIQPYSNSFDPSGLPFMFTEFAFLRAEFFGAAAVDVEERGKTAKLWIDGFRIEVAWKVSENGPGQHE